MDEAESQYTRGIIELAEICSVPVVRFDEQEGQFTDTILVSLEEVMASGDPWGFCKHRLAQHLAGCVKSTGLPLNEGVWLVKFGPFAQANFNCPPTAVV